MPDEYAVFNLHALTDECVAGNLAALSHHCIFLNLNKRADLGFISNLATIKIDEFRKANVLSEPDVGSNANELPTSFVRSFCLPVEFLTVQRVVAHASATVLAGLKGIFALSSRIASLRLRIDSVVASSIFTTRRPARPSLNGVKF